MTTTTTIGTWCNTVNAYETSPETAVDNMISGADSDWRELLDASGILDTIQTEYRYAIDTALPPEISLCGNEFIGPADTSDCDWSDYPENEDGGLDIAAIVEDIDLAAIIERHEPWTIDQVADHLGVKVGSARGMLSRWKVKAVTYAPVTSPRPQAVYDSADILEAEANRPGQGARTDKA